MVLICYVIPCQWVSTTSVGGSVALRRSVASTTRCAILVRARALTVFCYYPSEEYIRCLDAAAEAEHLDDIDCGDLFRRNQPRERIAVYRFADR